MEHVCRVPLPHVVQRAFCRPHQVHGDTERVLTLGVRRMLHLSYEDSPCDPCFEHLPVRTGGRDCDLALVRGLLSVDWKSAKWCANVRDICRSQGEVTPHPFHKKDTCKSTAGGQTHVCSFLSKATKFCQMRLPCRAQCSFLQRVGV